MKTESWKPKYAKRYVARLDIYYIDSKDTMGGLNESAQLTKMPTLKWCEAFFKKSMESRVLTDNEYFTIDVQVYAYDTVGDELDELIEIIDLKEYK